MRILFVATALDLPEAFLVRGLIERGVDVRLLLSTDSKHLQVLKAFKERITFISLRNRIDLRAIRSIRALIKSFCPEVIHSLSARALSNSLMASWGFAANHVAYRGTMGNLSYWDPSSRISFLHPKLNKIICVSDAVRNDLAKLGVPEHKLIRIYKGHDPAWYEITCPVSRSDLGIDAGKQIVSCVANNRPVKGIDTLIRAFLLIPLEQPLELLLIGEVRDDSLRRLAANDRRIHFLGFRSDAAALVACSDLFCMPSRRREGFPKALIEAMIQGIPAVVTSVGGLPEMVIHGHNGIVVNPDAPQELADALVSLAGDPGRCALFGSNARSRVLEHFPIESTIEQTLGVYRELSGELLV